MLTKALSSYLQKFKGAVNVVKSSDISSWAHLSATKIEYNKMYAPSNYRMDKNNNLTEYQTASIEAQRQYLASLFFQGLRNKSHK